MKRSGKTLITGGLFWSAAPMHRGRFVFNERRYVAMLKLLLKKWRRIIVIRRVNQNKAAASLPHSKG